MSTANFSCIGRDLALLGAVAEAGVDDEDAHESSSMTSECRPRPADRSHETQSPEGECSAEGDPEQAPGPGPMLCEREDQARHDDGEPGQDTAHVERSYLLRGPNTTKT